MNRRIFVKNTLIISGGIILSQSFLSCNSGKTQLKNLIGQPESLLGKYKKNGW